jgi:predicted outer membrane repeat protein
MRTLLFYLVLITTGSICSAETYWVYPDGSGDFQNIQIALVSVTDGDSIILGNGTHAGAGNRDILFPAWDIVLRSEAGDPSSCVLDCGGSAGDPHRAFALTAGPGTPSIEGITFTNGFHEDVGQMGGAVRCEGTEPVFLNCVFSNNRANKGGCFFAGNHASPRFEGCRFIGNSAAISGGAIWAILAEMEFIDCTFQGNVAGLTDLGAGAAIDMGAIDESLRIIDCRFIENSASASGGAVSVGTQAYVEILSSHFENNQAEGKTAGALSMSSCDALIEDCHFIGNHCDELTEGTEKGGGAIRMYGANATINDCLFADNASASYGGAISAVSSQLNMDYCTLVRNKGAIEGGGIVISSPLSLRISLSNTIIAFSSYGGAISCNDGLHIGLSCCDVFGNVGGDWVGCIADQKGIDGNIWKDPLFCQDQNPDLPWALRADSPCAPENNSECGLIGAYGVGCIATATASASWSRLKALY